MSDEKMVIGHESHDTGEKEISDRDEMIGDALIRSMASMGLSTMEILGILQSAAAKCCVAFSPTIESAHQNVDAGSDRSGSGYGRHRAGCGSRQRRPWICARRLRRPHPRVVYRR